MGLRFSQNSAQHCRIACTVTQTAVVVGKRRLRLGFVFPTEKGSTPSVLAVLVLCLRLLAFVMHRLTATSCLPDLANSLWKCTTVRARKLQLMFSILRSTTCIKLTKGKSSWRLKPHWDPGDCSATPCIEISSTFPKYLRQTPLDLHRLPTDAGLKSSLRPLSDILALGKQKSAL